MAASFYVIIRAGVFSAGPLQTARPRRNLLHFTDIVLVLLFYICTGSAAAVVAQYVPATPRSSLIEIVAGLSVIVAVVFFANYWFEQKLSGLGVVVRNIPRGLVLGFLSFVAIAPILYIVLAVTDVIAKHVTHHLPPVHPALKAMASDHSPVSLGMLVFIVVVVAPISEEFFFRGLIQSWLSQKLALGRAKSPPPHQPSTGNLPDWEPYSGDPAELTIAPPTSAAAATGAADIPGVSAPVTPPIRNWPQAPWLPWSRWIAILITAVVFAGVHYMVTPGYDEYFPVLFLLGVALGYMYERTGNIWTDITMHACFNLIPTLLILSGVQPK
ncbi:MAG: CPBP family intramembrane glutamic endopeptidase [Phycisphaerae bacterium]